MRRRYFYALTFMLFSVTHATFAQNGNELSVPSTPAFSILNYEPAAIMRPSNPKELSADILNSFDPSGKLLLNLGIEVAPYWLKSRPYLTREQYLDASGQQIFLQSLMLSAATVKDSLTDNNKLGAGFRFKIVDGKVSPEYREAEAQLISRATMMAAVSSARVFIQTNDDALRLKDTQEVVTFIDEILRDSASQFTPDDLAFFREMVSKVGGNFDNTVTDLIAYTEMINAAIDEESAELKRQVVALAKRRIGFIAEVAGASSFFTTAHDKFEKAGIWINASNVVSQTDAWNFSARYFFADSDSATSNFDFGLAYIKELSNLSLSVEAMGRSYRAEIPDFNINNEPITIVEKDFTYRLAAQASYRIAEDISVNLSFGKNFDSPFIERGGFFSILGVRYSIFKSNVAGMPAARALK